MINRHYLLPFTDTAQRRKIAISLTFALSFPFSPLSSCASSQQFALRFGPQYLSLNKTTKLTDLLPNPHFFSRSGVFIGHKSHDSFHCISSLIFSSWCVFQTLSNPSFQIFLLNLNVSLPFLNQISFFLFLDQIK